MTADRSSRRDLLLTAWMALVLVAAWWWQPGAQADVQVRAQVPMEQLVPARFGAWRLDPVTVGLVRPAVEAAKAYEMYDQVLERIYVNEDGERVMLSVAYGRRQSVGLQMHRPEVCYRTGGFQVTPVGQFALALPGQRLMLDRLVAHLGVRHEPISYWRLLGDEQVLDDGDFRWAQLRQGWRRQIADGLLFRVSSLGEEQGPAFALQERFIRDLNESLTPQQRVRLMGRASTEAGEPPR